VKAPKPTLLALACVLVPLVCAAAGWSPGNLDEVPDWAATLGLFVFGGPAAAPVRVQLNDSLVAEIASGGQGRTFEVLEALASGPNELSVEFLPAESAGEASGRLTVALATSQRSEDGKRRLDEAIAESSLPEVSGDDACTERFRFWAGPPPEQAEELKKEYFLAVQGPPVGYLVTVSINGHPVYTTTKGERFFEVSPFIHKGKNSVSFDAVPACFHETITASGELVIVIAAGRMTPEGFQWEGQVLGQLELEHRKNPQPFSRRQNFRAR
jgi:hypothetical protein